MLHQQHGVPLPQRKNVKSLFGTLVAAGKLPGFIDNLVLAAAGPRNQMASHGTGATVRVVPEELADAAIGAAANAIVLLRHYLP